MKPITLTSMALVAATQFLNALAASPTGTAVQSPTALPVLGQLTSHGCYKSQGNLTVMNDVDHVSSGICGKACTGAGWNVMGLHGSKCYCGMVYPPQDAIAADSECNYPCPGYALEACGSISSAEIFSVFNTGVEVDVADYAPESSSTSAAPSATSAAATSAVESPVVTETGDATPSSHPNKEEKKGPNTAAIAAGVVVGVVVFGAAIGALFFVMRRKRNAEIEEEHRRNAAVNAFIHGSKPPGSSGSISMTDSRLDPVMAHRRMSDGSIADNQDYSRRILRVTNA